MRRLISNRPLLVSIAVALLCFALFSIIYLDGRIHGDQLGLWSYITTDEHRSPFALWNSRASGGAPEALNPEYSYLDPSYIVNLLVRDIVLRSLLVNIVYLLILAGGVFWLTLHLTKDAQASVISGTLAVLSTGAVIRSIGNNPYLFAMAYLPYIILFLIRTLQTPSYANSFFLACFGALLVISGGIGTLMWLMFYMPFFLIIYFVLYFNKKLVSKQAVFLAITFALFALFALFKLWAGITYVQDGLVRSDVQPYQLFLQGTGYEKGFFSAALSLVWPGFEYDHIGLWIGLIGFSLLALSLVHYKKKHYLLILSLVIISILVVADTPVTHLAHSVPFLNRTKDVVKGLFLYATMTAVLAGFGFSELRHRFSFFKNNFAVPLLIILIMVQFMLFFVIFPRHLSNESLGIPELLKQETLLNSLDRTEPLRIAYQDLTGGRIQIRFTEFNIDTSDWIHGNGYSLPYLVYKQVAAQTKTAELLGALNVKYIYSRTPLATQGYKLIKSGTSEYLYENTAFLPRYRFISAVAINDPPGSQNTYGVISSPYFNVSTTALVTVEKISSRIDYPMIIVPAPRQEDALAFSTYVQSGGLLYPDYFSTNKNVTLEQALSSINTPSQAIKSFKRGNDRLELQIDKPGWVMLSETFSIYSGWQARFNHKTIPIYRADGILTAVNVPEPGTLVFEYRPASFYIGGLISGVSFVFAASLLFVLHKRKLAHE